MSASLVAVVGNPNCGKSALFNALTGLRQKVANYPGATVERRTGRLKNTEDDGSGIELIDLPGTYSLQPKSPDEQVTRDVLLGEREGEAQPSALVVVVDATNLAQHLKFVLELRGVGLPMVLALNMTDLAEREEIEIDADRLSALLGMPVIRTVAVRGRGLPELTDQMRHMLSEAAAETDPLPNAQPLTLRERQQKARAIAREATVKQGIGHRTTRLLDQIFLHKLAGPVILFSLLFLIFQAVFSWAEAPMDWIDGGIGALQGWLPTVLSDGPVLSLLSDGLLSGVGAVIVFLPQIIILFAFILVLESTGYMARAAFLMDRLMASVGLNGRAFLPLLSSFACAIPGIMAARTIPDTRDRITTIMIAPLMACSARLPVYTLMIAAFIPSTSVGGVFNLQGLVMFGLYLVGILSALIAAAVLKRTLVKGAPHPFLMELPKYQWPQLKLVLLGLLERVRIFMRRAGTIILVAMVLLWGLASFPGPPAGATEPPIFYSLVGMIGRALEVVFAPLGFNWEISVALVPGLAAREVAVAALGTVYALQGSEEIVAEGLVGVLNSAWTLPTALSFLAWYVFAPQCLSTLAVTRRETNSWGWAAFMAGYLFALAYLFAALTYQVASALLG